VTYEKPPRMRKSRARVPPITPEERSAINAANARKDGRYAADRRLTQEHAESIIRRCERIASDLADIGEAPPLAETVCPAWRSDAVAMTDHVIQRFGARTSRNQKLTRIDDALPWAPDNLTGWLLMEPKLRRRSAPRARYDLEALLDCACDHRAQATCARSARPCDWALARRDDAPWHEPP
jgi:hypothetical protein